MECKKAIEEAIQTQITNGVKIGRQRYGVYSSGDKYALDNFNTCCGLGCYLVGKPVGNTYLIDLLSKSLQVTQSWITTFVSGFDGHEIEINPADQEAYDFGKEMWDKYGNKEGY